MIKVTLATPDTVLDRHWAALSSFTHNVFMHPAALRAARETLPAPITVLLAWNLAAKPEQLVGMWAFRTRRLLTVPYLDALPYEYAVLSTPILHPDRAEDVMSAFLGVLAAEPSLPKTILLRELDGAGHEYSVLEQAAADHFRTTFRAADRPIATREAGLKRSGSTRKKLRQDWNRLAATGALEMTLVRATDKMGAAFEAFLTLEDRSWKGDNGTALLSKAEDARFARHFFAAMAAKNDACVGLLSLDGKPIAAQVVLFAGRTAYTWKMAFDPDYARFSPGMLLVDRVCTDLIDSGIADVVDSCSRSDGFMGRLLSGRKPIKEMVVSAKPGFTFASPLIAGYFHARERLKELRGKLMRRRPGINRPTPAMPVGTSAGQAAPAPWFEQPRERPALSGRVSTTDRAA